MAAAVVTAALLHYLAAPDLVAFAAATVALAGLAWLVSFATEQVAERFGPAVTGVLQSTLGNLPEFFIVLFALSAGQVVVAQFSLVGSLFANALLVLGLVVVTGASRAEDGVMRFHPRLPNDTATLVFLTVFIIVVVGSSAAANDEASKHVVTISAIGAVAILAVYLAWLVPYLTSGEPQQAGHAGGAGRVSFPVAGGLLALAGTGAAFVSDWFIAELEPTIERLGISQAFAGLVIAAIAGNAVENATGVVLAYKGESDLAISVVKNSVAQISAFLFPALVLVSLLFAERVTFELDPVYIGALVLTAIVVWQTTGDGVAPAFEGWALVAVYVILATLTLFE
ncbi:MAG: sodium:proton exchanger [Actinomycetota bacterium]|nr:sodium:proton exchanger [Actinomycetota bacterium]